MLDSLAELHDVPDSLMAQTLRIRVLLGASEYQGQQIIPLAKGFISWRLTASAGLKRSICLWVDTYMPAW